MHAFVCQLMCVMKCVCSRIQQWLDLLKPVKKQIKSEYYICVSMCLDRYDPNPPLQYRASVSPGVQSSLLPTRSLDPSL